jgi:spermidine synthase
VQDPRARQHAIKAPIGPDRPPKRREEKRGVTMSRRRLVWTACGVLAFACAAAAQAGDRVYESVYNAIFVSRQGTTVSLRQMEDGKPQSAIDLANPTFQVLPYTRYLFAAALLQPQPSRVLSIGLGAGAFNRLFNAAYPQAGLTTVEIDPMILRLAVELTGLRTSPENQVVVADGRRFLSHSRGTWDWIVMDPYLRHSQIPPQLTTLEFFRVVAAHLSPDGVFVLNIVGTDALFYSLVATLRRVFPNSLVFAVPGTGNRVFLGAGRATPQLPSLIDDARLGGSAGRILARNGVDFAAIRRTVAAVDLPPGTPVLTDDFAPAEYLGAVWAK